MISLSKIFKTNKLSYILRESKEDDFTVDAPKGWDINNLKIGDTIVPNMWDKERIEQAISQDMISFPNWFSQPHTIESFTHHEDVAFTDGTKRSLYFLKIFLQPQYQINIDPLSESDEWNVTPDEKEWNSRELKVGDTFITDTFHTDDPYKIVFIGKAGETRERFNYYKFNDNDNIVLFEISSKRFFGGEKYLAFSIGYFNDKYGPLNNAYVSEFITEQDKDEFNDFNITPDPVWGAETLKVFDYIKPTMWKNTSLIYNVLKANNLLRNNAQIIDIGNDDEGPYVKLQWPNGSLLEFDYEDVLNSLDSSQVTLKDYLSESQDEFNVDAPQEWNEYDGNIIITYKVHNEGKVYVPEADEEEFEQLNPNIEINYDEEPIYINTVNKTKSVSMIDFIEEMNSYSSDLVPFTGPKTLENFKAWLGYDDEDILSAYQFLDPRILKYEGTDVNFNPVKLTNSMKNHIDWNVDEVGVEILDVQFIDNINESENEFTVDAPKDWNKIELTVGDKITPDMYTDEAVERWNYLSNQKMGSKTWGQSVNYFWTKPQTIYKVFSTYDGNYDLELESGLVLLSSDLKDQYLIVSNMLESKDEFTVDAPQDWNIKELGVGDILNNTNMEISDVNFSYKITDFKKNEYGSDLVGIIKYEVDDNGVKQQNKKPSYWYVSMVNKKLKPGYQVVVPEPLKESDDDFNVTPDESWNVTYLQVGDKITYDMLRDGSTDKRWFSKNKDAYFELEDFKNGMYTISRYNPKNNSFSPRYRVVPEWFNNSTLDPQYKLEVPLNNQVNIFGLDESDDDFTVDAPKEWGIEELTVGDTLDPSNLKMQNFRKKYEILGFHQRPWGNEVRLGVYELVAQEPIPGTRRTNKQWKQVKVYYASLKSLEDLLKPGYKIVPNTIVESDDDFTIDAPKEWNLNYEQPINITISYEEEVRDRTGKYGVLLKSYFTQTNLTELEQVAGYNFPYDELTPSNVQRFIIDDQDLLIEIEDMSNNPNIEVIESYNGFDFDNYQVRGLNNFYVDVELPVA